MTKFITINAPAVDWLTHVVVDCGASGGSTEFYKVRTVGSSVLIAQRCHNNSGCFFLLFEYEKDVKGGFLAIPEGEIGEG